MSVLAVPPASTPTRARAAGWLVALVVLGVVAMHGLGGHGMAPAQTQPQTGMAASMPIGMGGHPDGTTHATVAAGGAVAAPAHGGHGMVDAGMMCVAVLAGAGLLLLLAGRRRSGILLRAGLRRAHLLRPPHRRPGGPPPVWEYSVIRC